MRHNTREKENVNTFLHFIFILPRFSADHPQNAADRIKYGA
jgi:hypothetical protein